MVKPELSHYTSANAIQGILNSNMYNATLLSERVAIVSFLLFMLKAVEAPLWVQNQFQRLSVKFPHLSSQEIPLNQIQLPYFCLSDMIRSYRLETRHP